MGVVLNGQTSMPIQGANITIQDREEFVIRTTASGEYWRILLPGTYTLKVSRGGDIPW